jgi:hypothetical protein
MLSFRTLDHLGDIALAAWKRAIRPDAEPEDRQRAEETRLRRDYALDLWRLQQIRALTDPCLAEALLSNRLEPARLARMADVAADTYLVGVAVSQGTGWIDALGRLTRQGALLQPVLTNRGAALPPQHQTTAFRPILVASKDHHNALVTACPAHFPRDLHPFLHGLVAPDQDAAWLEAPLTPAERSIIDR